MEYNPLSKDAMSKQCYISLGRSNNSLQINFIMQTLSTILSKAILVTGKHKKHSIRQANVLLKPMPSNNPNWSPWKSYYQSYGKRWIGHLNLALQPSRLKTPLNPLLHNHHNCHLPTSMMVNHLNLHIHSVKTQISYHRCTLLVLVASR